MSGWIGPALIAATIAAIVSVAGWFVTAGQALRTEQRRRLEKTRDFQIALRAEIRAELADLEGQDFEADLATVLQRYGEDPTYSIRASRLPRHRIFEAILPEISVLPEEVIDPIVLYARQRQVIDEAVEDIRDPSFQSLSRERQREIVQEYVGLLAYLRELARLCDAVLSGRSIGESAMSSRKADDPSAP